MRFLLTGLNGFGLNLVLTRLYRSQKEIVNEVFIVALGIWLFIVNKFIRVNPFRIRIGGRFVRRGGGLRNELKIIFVA